MAAQRLGAQCLVIDNIKSSSMSKGETFSDTFWTLHCMRPDLFVIRCGGEEPLVEVSKQSDFPVINAGFGSKGHPTQALLDTFTLLEQFPKPSEMKVLFVGDIDHSRVFSSSARLLKRMGAQVRTCAPSFLSQNSSRDFENFEDLQKAIAWCNVYNGLRVQFERHDQQKGGHFSKEDFVSSYSLNRDRLDLLSQDAVILHPGPVNWGVEFQDEVKNDKRLMMWEQKENGVYVRAALMESILKG